MCREHQKMNLEEGKKVKMNPLKPLIRTNARGATKAWT